MYQITYYILMALFIFISLFMILLVLIQKGRGGGLSSAFTGSGGNTAFGSKTGDVLTWVTSVTFGIFVLLAIIMNLMVVNWKSPTRKEADDAKNGPKTTQNDPQIITTLPTSQPVEAVIAPASLPVVPAIPATAPSTLPN